MSFTPILALGILSQSIFFGGNVAISGLFIPIIRGSQVSPSVQLKLWEKIFYNGSKLMVASAITSTACFLYQAYIKSDKESRRAMLVTAGFSISVLFFTRIVMFPTIRHLQELANLSNEVLEFKNFGALIDYWNQLSIVRTILFSAGFVNALWYHVTSS